MEKISRDRNTWHVDETMKISDLSQHLVRV